MKVAVAEAGDDLAPRLGRAVKFALFDVEGGKAHGPCYRVRHDDPGQACDEHSELSALLRDCAVVIAGGIGPEMARRLTESGVDPVATRENGSARDLVMRYVAGRLERDAHGPCGHGLAHRRGRRDRLCLPLS